MTGGLESLVCHPRQQYKKSEARDFLGESRNKINHLMRMGVLPHTKDNTFLGRDIYSRLQKKNPKRINELGYYSNTAEVENEMKLEKALRAEGLSGKIEAVDRLGADSLYTQKYFLILLTLSRKQQYVTPSTVYSSSKEELLKVLDLQQPLFSRQEAELLLNTLALNGLIQSQKDSAEARRYKL
jgi:hypothetical protein